LSSCRPTSNCWARHWTSGQPKRNSYSPDGADCMPRGAHLVDWRCSCFCTCWLLRSLN